MRLKQALLLILGLCAGILFLLYSDQFSLFRREKPTRSSLDFLKELPELPPPAPKPTRKASDQARGSVEKTPEKQLRIAKQVPNGEVGRVLMQILAAKRLGKGISLTVTDEEIVVFGEISSDPERNQIIDILNKGRESRQLNLDHLKTVRNE